MSRMRLRHGKARSGSSKEGDHCNARAIETYNDLYGCRMYLEDHVLWIGCSRQGSRQGRVGGEGWMMGIENGTGSDQQAALLTYDPV